MLFRTDIKNCRIIIYSDATGAQIGDTTIKRFNSNTDIGVVDGSYLKTRESQQVSALVFAWDGLFECRGTLRPTLAGSEVEVCFYKKADKNDRGCTRYDVNMLGNVISVTRKVPTEEGSNDFAEIETKDIFQCKVVNMSATGVLISVPSGHLAVGDIVQLSVFKDGHRLKIIVEAIRKHSANIQTEQYGCKIVQVLNQ